MEEGFQEISEHWSLYLHRRVMRLLLLHDRRLFRGQFHTFYAQSSLPQIPLLQQYDRYIRLLSLSDELLDDIVPRIRRQLSLQTTQLHLQEEAPTHGDIDWQRTMQRNLNETPGLVPLRFDTRLRERSMALPENILTVSILLAFRRELQAALFEGMDDEALTEQERQVLVGADERAERELAAPYARSLLNEAQHSDIETLSEYVLRLLRPGSSPYRDLIAWWHHFTHLRIGRTFDEKARSLASKRNNEKTDAWLYELWLALEIVHLLNDARAISSTGINVATDTLQFTFTWNSRRLRFIYNRQSDLSAGTAFGWRDAPTSRPDYTIEREQPLKVSHNGTVIWREPPVILDAKYYLSGSDPTRTHGPIKKLLGDMQLLGTQRAGLFFRACLSQHLTNMSHGLFVERTGPILAKCVKMFTFACTNLPLRCHWKQCKHVSALLLSMRVKVCPNVPNPLARACGLIPIVSMRVTNAYRSLLFSVPSPTLVQMYLTWWTPKNIVSKTRAFVMSSVSKSFHRLLYALPHAMNFPS